MGPIIVGNAFAGPFIPSPNIYHLERDELRPVAQVEKVDLIGVDWCANRGYCVTVGYDVVWHEPKVYIWRGELEEVVVGGEGGIPHHGLVSPGGRHGGGGHGISKPLQREEGNHLSPPGPSPDQDIRA